MDAFIEVLANGIVEDYLAGLAATTAEGGPGGALARGAMWGVGFAAAAGGVRAGRRGLRPLVRSAVLAGDWVRDFTFQAGGVVREIYAEAQTDRAGTRPIHRD